MKRVKKHRGKLYFKHLFGEGRKATRSGGRRIAAVATVVLYIVVPVVVFDDGGPNITVNVVPVGSDVPIVGTIVAASVAGVDADVLEIVAAVAGFSYSGTLVTATVTVAVNVVVGHGGPYITITVMAVGADISDIVVVVVGLDDGAPNITVTVLTVGADVFDIVEAVIGLTATAPISPPLSRS